MGMQDPAAIPTQAIPASLPDQPLSPRKPDVGIDQDIQAVYDAQHYIRDFNQWLTDHPGQTPSRDMVDRYKAEIEYVAQHYKL
jgi:hypothetical protein